MTNSKPGITRENRLSDDGLARLEKQLRRGKMNSNILKQWIKRYGDKARKLIKKYDQYHDDMEK